MGVDSKRFPGPAYEDVQPRLPNQPRNPHAPKHPHIPFKKRATAVALAVAMTGTAVGLTLRRNDPMPFSDTVTAAGMTQEQEEFLYDGRQLVRFTKSPTGEISYESTSKAQVLKAESFNLEEGQGLSFTENIALPKDEQTVAVTLSPDELTNAYFVPVLGKEIEVKTPYGDIPVDRSIAEADKENEEPIIKLDKGPQGTPYLRLSHADGTPIEGSNGKPIYAELSQVNLQIPEQALAPVSV